MNKALFFLLFPLFMIGISIPSKCQVVLDNQQVENIFSGKNIKCSIKYDWSTHYYDYHFCSSGKVFLGLIKDMESPYTTGWSRESFTDYGTWKIIKQKANLFFIHMAWANGNQSDLAIEFNSNGSYWIFGMTTVRLAGQAQCY